MQIQISWLLKKPTDLDLHCLQRQDISEFSRTRVNVKTGFNSSFVFTWVKVPHIIMRTVTVTCASLVYVCDISAHCRYFLIDHLPVLFIWQTFLLTQINEILFSSLLVTDEKWFQMVMHACTHIPTATCTPQPPHSYPFSLPYPVEFHLSYYFNMLILLPVEVYKNCCCKQYRPWSDSTF